MNKNIKRYIQIITILALVWILYQAGCYGYWWLRAWEGDYYSKLVDNVKKLPSEQVIRKLHSFDITSPYPQIAIQILTERKEKKALLDLLKLSKSWNRHIRRDAIWALGLINDPRAIEPLMNIVRKGDKYTDFRTALIALSDMKYDGVFPYIVEIANKEYPKNCAAISLLKEFGKPESISLLLKIKGTIKDGTPNAQFYKSSINDAIKEITTELKNQ